MKSIEGFIELEKYLIKKLENKESKLINHNFLNHLCEISKFSEEQILNHDFRKIVLEKQRILDNNYLGIFNKDFYNNKKSSIKFNNEKKVIRKSNNNKRFESIEMNNISFSLPSFYNLAIEKMIDLSIIPNRSDLIRELVQNIIEKDILVLSMLDFKKEDIIKKSKIITANIPKLYIDKLDKIIKNNKIYKSRSEALRTELKHYITKKFVL